MNNRLNTIGLSTLAASALVAMSTLGYSMATANQASAPTEENNKAIVVDVTTQEEPLAFVKPFQQPAAILRSAAPGAGIVVEQEEPALANRLSVISPSRPTTPVESEAEAAGPTVVEEPATESTTESTTGQDEEPISNEPVQPETQVPQAQAAGRIVRPLQPEATVTAPSATEVVSASSAPQTGEAPDIAPDGQSRRRENPRAGAATVNESAGDNNGRRRNPDRQARPQRNGENRPDSRPGQNQPQPRQRR